MRRIATVVTLCLLGSAPFAGGSPASQGSRQLVDQSYLCLRTLAELRSVRTALQAYALDHGGLPRLASVEGVRELIEPAYIHSATLVDAWGTPFALDVSADGEVFSLASAGSDRKFERAAWTVPGLLLRSTEDAVLYSESGKDREWVIQE